MSSLGGVLSWLVDVEWQRVDWGHLAMPLDFKWQLGVTPFSHPQIPAITGVIYLLCLFGFQRFMQNRRAMELKWISVVHNGFLTALSMVMFLGASYGVQLKYESQGFWAGLVCEQDRDPIKGPLFFFSYIFYLSKYYELLDSFLLVAKKKPLLFLHVFHHTVMPFVCWAGLEGKWCMALWTSTFWNSLVHVIMYYYYFVSTLGANPWWKKYLTIVQIYQFVSGVIYTYTFFLYYFQDFKIVADEHSVSVTFNKGCTGDLWAIVFMFAVNNSFLYLFSRWYFQTYSRTRKPSGVSKTVVAGNTEGKKFQ